MALAKAHHRLKSVPLDKDYGLRTGNVETFAAGTAGQHVVNAHHVVARVLKLPAIVFAGAAWGRRLFGSLQPAHFVIVTGATVRAAKACGF
jgi:hypothetical protein